VGAQASASDGLPRGWDSAPYVRYEAEHALRGGGATDRTAFDFDPANTAVEASGRHYVGLPATGSHLEWAVTNAGSGLTLRFTLPDNASGAGVAGSLDLYVNGTNTVTVDLSSYWAWTYFVSSNPRNTPGVRPRMRFDEIHLGLPAPLQPGDVVRLQKNITDTFEYGIDFVEVEPVPPPLAQPPGYLSVTSYGANGGDALPDSAAFRSAWQAAVAAGTGLYVPPGRFLLTNQWNLGASSGIGLQGAGIWHTELHFPTKAVGGGGLYVAEGTHQLDISHFFMSSVLNERYLVPGVISDYKAFNGSFGNNSRIHDLWITHFRDRGVAGGRDVAGQHLQQLPVRQQPRAQHLRGRRQLLAGHPQLDRDALQLPRQRRRRAGGVAHSKQGAPEGRYNTFHHNTVEFTYRAGGIGIFGGFGHEAPQPHPGRHRQRGHPVHGGLSGLPLPEQHRHPHLRKHHQRARHQPRPVEPAARRDRDLGRRHPQPVLRPQRHPRLAPACHPVARRHESLLQQHDDPGHGAGCPPGARRRGRPAIRPGGRRDASPTSS
jgi:hypothetical protein